MRYDAEHKARTRSRLLIEAARALREVGPHKLGVAEVMGRAGLTHGGFYAHFESKEALVAAAMDAAFADAARRFERAAGGSHPRAALAAYVEAYLSMAHRDRRDRGCPLPALAADLPRLGEDVRERYAQGLRRLTARLHGLLEAADIADAEALAPSIVAELVGALSIARAVPDAAEAARLLARSRDALAARLNLGDIA